MDSVSRAQFPPLPKPKPGSLAQGATERLMPAAPLAAAPGSSFAFAILVLLVIIHFARPFDMVLSGYRIPAIVCSIAIVVAFFVGGLKALRSKVGISFLLLIAWMCIAAPFSTWKGGTFKYVLGYAQFYLPLMVLAAAACKTPRQIVKISAVLAFSCIAELLLARTDYSGRYALRGTFGNPDDVALLAGYTIPFFVLICSRLKNPVMRYGLTIMGCGYLLLLIGRTGTRAALVALVGLFAVYFLRGKGVQRMALIAFSVMGVMIVMMLLPSTTIKRLETVIYAFNPSGHYDNSEAEGSALERHDLLRDGIKATLEHPIVGVGASMFMQYRFDHMMLANGLHKHYMPAHNTYVEIMSENGIPGVIFYCIFLGAIYLQVRATRKLTLGQTGEQAELVRAITLCVEAALVYFAVCAAFMTCDKNPLQFVLAGLAIAMEKMAASWLGRPAAATQPAFSIPTVPIVRKRPYPVGMR